MMGNNDEIALALPRNKGNLVSFFKMVRSQSLIVSISFSKTLTLMYVQTPE